jgi:hypothetical protein
MKMNKTWLIAAIVLGLLIGWNQTSRFKKLGLKKILEPNPERMELIYQNLSVYSQMNLEILLQHYCRCTRVLVIKDSSLMENAWALDRQIEICLEDEMSELSSNLDKELKERYAVDEDDIYLYRTALIMNAMGRSDACPEQQEYVLNIVRALSED